MRIVYFSHFYPPSACGGAGYYTAALAEGFVRCGNEVSVLCVEAWGEGPHYFNGSKDEVRNGVRIRRLLINWKKAPRPFDWLYDSPEIGELALKFLHETNPDVVHASSAYTLSARPLLIAAEMGIPTVLHQHDYWTVCARHTLLHKSGNVCTGPETPWKCQRCLLEGTKVDRKLSKVFSEDLRDQTYKTLGRLAFVTRLPGFIGMLGDLPLRRQTTFAAAVAANVVITPTTFARDLLVVNGFPSRKIVVMPYGNQLDWTSRVRRTESSKLRLGFLGNVIRLKGVHVLVAAFNILSSRSNEVELAIWGDTGLEPDYAEALKKRASRKVVWGGRYEREDLPLILSEVDVLVVPSIWYETQGIVIQEAFAAGVPVLVSAGTSLTATVEHEGNGLHFRQGSVSDLVKQIERLKSEPHLVSRLRDNILPVRSIERDLQELATLYYNISRNPKRDRILSSPC